MAETNSKQKIPPLIFRCFWCGRDVSDEPFICENTDTSLPTEHTIISYAPCKHCLEIADGNIMVAGVKETPWTKNMPPISVTSDDNVSLYPTGNMFLASKEWVHDFLLANVPDDIKKDAEDIFNEACEKHILIIQDELCAEYIERIRAENPDVPEFDVQINEGDVVNEDN